MAKHRWMPGLQHFAIAQVHMGTTWQTGIEAPYHPHNVDSLNFIRPVLFKNWGVLDCILIRSWYSEWVPRTGIPAGRRIGMIIRNFAILLSPCDARAHPGQLREIRNQSPTSGTLNGAQVCVRPACTSRSALSANRVRRGRHMLGRSTGAVTFDLHCSIAESSTQTGPQAEWLSSEDLSQHCVPWIWYSRYPLSLPKPWSHTWDGTTASVQRQILIRAFVEPSRRHYPVVLALKIMPQT